MWQRCQLSPNFIVNGRVLAWFASVAWCLLHCDAKHDMKKASRFKCTEGARFPAWPRDAYSLALSQHFAIFPLTFLPSEARAGSTGLCATSIAPAVHARGLGPPQLPHPCLGSLGARSLEMSLPRANRPRALHPHQALPSASKGCSTSAAGCAAT